MELENQNSNLPEEERAAAEKLHTRLRRLSEVPNLEGVVISMFEFYAHLPTPYLTPIFPKIRRPSITSRRHITHLGARKLSKIIRQGKISFLNYL